MMILKALCRHKLKESLYLWSYTSVYSKITLEFTKEMNPFMIYNGNHLFHYTSFEAAIKICASLSLRFGAFSNMNDIAEASRNIGGMLPVDEIEKELATYKSISLTRDKATRRGFAIDPLWGHYAQKGNGVCLVFDREIIEANLAKQFGGRAMMRPISYLPNATNAIFFDSEKPLELEKEIAQDIEEIFFTKSLDWEYEQEERILLKTEDNETFLNFENEALIVAILCLPRTEKYEDSTELKILKAILVDKPVLRYNGSLGGYKLFSEDGEAMCDIWGEDIQLDI